MWRRHWPNLVTIFDYPPEIRKVIYTTNAIESLNSVIRKSVRKRKLFPSDTAALKVVYLSAMEASKRWKRPVRDWKNALNQFAIHYDGELNFQSWIGAYTVSCTDSSDRITTHYAAPDIGRLLQAAEEVVETRTEPVLQAVSPATSP
jgi:nitrous oxide reductase accessory protein NosL